MSFSKNYPSQQAASDAPRRRLIVVDPGVENYETLLAGLRWDNYVAVLNAEKDGISEITTLMRSLPEVQELHIISHGTPGTLYLGNTELSLATLGQYEKPLQDWFKASAPSLCLYGCRVAAGDVGRQFLARLQELSGARVAASSNLMGNAELGGSGILDYGPVDVQAVLSPAVLALYPGLLAAPTITDTATATRQTPEEETLAITGISVGDRDGDLQTVTLSAIGGSLTLASTAGLTGVTGNGTSSVSFSGSVANVNAALNGLDYLPDVDFNGNDTLSIATSDGVDTVTQTVAIAVTPVNDVPIVSPVPENVLEGDTVAFRPTDFNITDPDTLEEQVIIRIESLPTRGILKFNGAFDVVGSTFSADQISLLTYEHDGSQTTEPGGTLDSFLVRVDDGAGGVVESVPIEINIIPVDQPPTISATTTLFEGAQDQPVTISITDPDQTAPTFDIEVLNLPGDGVLSLNGVAVTAGQQFTSDDLANLTYSHNGNDQNAGFPPDDSFEIRVIDDGGGTGEPSETTTTVELRIRPNNDDPVLDVNAGIAYDIDTNPTRREIRITAADLSVSDVDSPVTQLTYTLTAAPDSSLGSVRVGGEAIGVGGSFTQDDINEGRVTYVFHGGSTGNQVFNDSFDFEVRDSEVRQWPTVRDGGIYPDDSSTVLSVNTFNIEISAPTPAPGGPGPALETNEPGTLVAGTITLNEGGAVAVTSADLSATDPDTPPEELVYTERQVPTSGSIQVNGVSIGAFGTFTQADIDNGLVTFVHDGGEDFIDEVVFTVSDGTNVTAEQTLTIDVTPINDAPTAAATGNPFLPEGGSVVLDSRFIALGDVDGSGEKVGTGFATPNNLSFRVTSLPVHGTLELGQGGTPITTGTVITQAQLDNGDLRYVHDGSQNFADSFDIRASDNTGEPNRLSSVATVNIDIASLNDDPEFVESVPLEVTEGGEGSIGGSPDIGTPEPHLVFGDPDNTAVQRQYLITTPTANGTLFLNGIAESTGSVFTQDDLDNNRVTYVHDGSENYTDSFDFRVSDGGGASVPGSYSISITPVNDAPELITPGRQVFDSDDPFVFSTANGNPILVGDVDMDLLEAGETDRVRVTLDLQADNATYLLSTLTLGSTTGVTVLSGLDGLPGGLLEFEGTLADVQAALEGLQVQVPTDEDRRLQLQVTVDDLNNGGPDPDPLTPGYSTTVTRTINIDASNENDPPTITAPDTTAAPIEVNEDDSFVFDGGNTISISDVDAFNLNSNRVTLQVEHGILNLGTTTGLMVTGEGTGTVTLQGRVNNINAALAGLSYIDDADYNGVDSLTVTVEDQGNTGLAGGALDPQTATQVIDLLVIPANDAPELTAPTGVQTIADDTALVFSGPNAIAVDDPRDLDNNGADTFEVTLTATEGGNPSGTLTVTPASGATVVDDGTATVTITGTRDQVNAALDGLTYTPDDFNSEATVDLVVNVNDLDNGGTGTDLVRGVGPALDVTQTVQINISEINEAPAITNPATVNVNEDEVLAFTGANAVSIADVDDFGNDLEVTLTVNNGTFTLDTTGLTFITGDGTGDTTATFTGTEAAINAALGTLTYQGNLNYTGPDTLNILVDDLGNTGVGGPLTDEQNVAIDVIAIDDAPVNTLTSPTQATDEDTPLTYSTANGNGISVGDVDANGADIQVTLTATNGTVALGGIAGLTTVTGDGSATVVLTGTVADINAALDGMVLTPDENFSGVAFVEVATDDLGNTGVGGPLTDTDTASIVVEPVNDAPVNVLQSVAEVVDEDVVLTFSAANNNLISVGDVDAGTEPVAVTLTAANGVLNLSGTANLTVTGDGSGSVTLEGAIADINAALDGMTYTPDADYFGPASVGITTDDQGNTGTGGPLSDADVVTVTVNNVNDAPVLDLDADDSAGVPGADYTTLFTPGAAIAIGDVDTSITDIDDTDIDAATLTLTNPLDGAAEVLELTGAALAAATAAGITVTAYDPTTGILTLTGAALLADYEAAIAAVTYRNAAAQPNRSDRTVTVVVSDGGPDAPDSNTAIATIRYDSDGDGVADAADLDDDNDGILDAVEENGDPLRDSDGDGVVDRLDLDADNDGLNDAVEAGHGAADADGDGTLDGPYGSNGLANSVETAPDSGTPNYTASNSDTDAVPDFQDTDSDNDTVPDLVEGGSGGADADGNGVVDGPDSDGDGVPDAVDGAPGFGDASSPVPRDTDSDGVLDYLDLDADNDGITDAVEQDGDPLRDTDGDGVLDYLDLDADNDGVADVIEAGGADPDGDGRLGSGPITDADGDGLADSVDTIDSGSGTGEVTGGIALATSNTDGTGRPDFQDIDADDDGLPDNIEAQPTAGYIGPNGADTDGDGLDDAYDPDQGGTALSPVNTDGTDQPDYQDLNSDSDRLLDIEENGFAANAPSGIDSDGDGLDDAFEGTTLTDADVNDEIDDPAALPNTSGSRDVDYRDVPPSGVILNEWSQGSDGGKEWVEFLVVGDGVNPTVNLQDAVLADTNRTMGRLQLSGPGFATIPVGTYLVIYNGNDPDDGLTLDTTLDIPNGDVGLLIASTNATGDYAITPAPSTEGNNAWVNGTTGAFNNSNGGDVPVLMRPGSGFFTADNTPVTYTDVNALATFYGILPRNSDAQGTPTAPSVGTLGGNGDFLYLGNDPSGITTDTNWSRDNNNSAPSGNSRTPGEPNAQVIITQSDGTTETVEGGATDTYTIVLRSQPTAPVTVTADPDDQTDLGNGPGVPVEFTFTPANWYLPQTVTVTAVDDLLLEDRPHPSAITHTVTSQNPDSLYNAGVPILVDGTAIANGEVPMAITDDEVDTDGDTIVDKLDLDDDNDGIVDSVEERGDLNRDTDGDGVLDRLDLDADGDGILDITEAGHGAVDGDGDGRVDGLPADFGSNGFFNALETAPDSGTPTYTPTNNDGDGVADFQDLDSDNDGINDLVEGSGLVPTPDANEDGLVDGPDSDGDGVADPVDTVSADPNLPAIGTALPLPDTDGDNRPDYQDLDSDNDGLPDLVEAGLGPVADPNGDGVADGPDADQDGILDRVDQEPVTYGDGPSAALPDSDGNGTPDTRELDSDGDGTPDRIEAALPSGPDTPDATGPAGQVDDPTDSDRDGIPDSIDSQPGVFGGFEDSDGDGIIDAIDLDDDNDGILDSVEQGGDPALDTDGDGVLDSRDLDADGDGILDIVEAGHDAIDADGDGRVDGPVGSNGFLDALETAPDSGTPTYTPLDTDGDGAADFQDLDADNDGLNDVIEGGGADPDGDGLTTGPDSDRNGVPDAVEGPSALPVPDSDGDGAADFRDLDTDNDGLSDLLEGGIDPALDADGNGVVDGADTDGDGILDAVDALPTYGDDLGAPLPDTDSDGTPGTQDLDSDGDGVSDRLQAGLPTNLDADGDGQVDDPTDSDQDGIPDGVDSQPGIFGGFEDSDGDGVVDALDLDDDNDGILDTVEQGGDPGRDTDGDGVLDSLDLDADGDGILDITEAGHGAADADGDGRVDGPLVGNGFLDSLEDAPDSGTPVYTPVDTDGDTVADFQDLDADNDGLNDVLEAGGSDPDGNGLVDGPDADGDGLVDILQGQNAALPLPDTDGDGVANYRDLDTDNDGVPDLLEGGVDPALDLDSNGVVDGPDADGDGIVDPVDQVTGHGDGGPTALPDADSDGTPDVQALDSDGDGVSDRTEAGLPRGPGTPDLDGNGQADDPTDTDGDGIADSVDSEPGSFGGFEDSDGDGIADVIDLDDDNDGILDTVEQQGNPARDTDGDGIIDTLDLDADNDGIRDLVEAGHGAADADNDGRVDGAPADFGTNGLLNGLETAPDSGTPTYIPTNTDGDVVPDFQDLDSDNDGINDVIEGGGTDANGDGLMDGTDANGNGIVDEVEGPGNALLTPDTDSDTRPDYQDLDTDNDGIGDLLEEGIDPGEDPDSNGVVDAPDSDGDGIADPVDAAPNTFGDNDTTPLPDSDGDGIPDGKELDSDNDGIPDRVKTELATGPGSPDVDRDGQVDDPTDSDADGIPDSIDSKPGLFGGFEDSDGDGIADDLDLDDDNDGIPDVVEDGDDFLRDTDGDGLIDSLDDDADGDGIFDVVEAGHGAADLDGDGRVDGDPADFGTNGLLNSLETAPDSGEPIFTPVDTDGDSRPDYQDLDADNDGINDVIEGGGVDDDGNGLLDGEDSDRDGVTDLADIDFGGTPLPTPDSDGDGAADFRDLDSDNDGVPDLVEAGIGPAADPDGNGAADGPDADGDGISDPVDATSTYGDNNATLLPDADGDLTPDARDLDSDGDVTPDRIQAGLLTGLGTPDTDGDGQVDDPTDSDGDGVPDSIDSLPSGYGGFEDTDEDGIIDALDLDDDNDGIFDTDEDLGDPNRDTDGDGIVDRLDLDADSDSIPDLYESGAASTLLPVLDADGDGQIDLGTAFGRNGFADALETRPDRGRADYNGDRTPDAPADTDGDGLADFQDLDTDSDGIPDIVEAALAGNPDRNGDGRVDDPTDSDGDGLTDRFDPSGGGSGSLPPLPDTDGDSVVDFRDLDSDNDGIADIVEAGGSDPDGNALVGGPDSNGNGWADALEGAGNGLPLPNSDNDRVADFRDLDSDNDGLSDLIEAGLDPLVLDTNDDSVVDGFDPDGDGLRNPVDGRTGTFGDTGSPALPDADGDGVPDYQERDSDADGVPDRVQAGLPTGPRTPDANADGLIDNPADGDRDGIPNTIDELPTVFGSPSGGDSDGDGITDILDLDDDNDGIPDRVEEQGDPNRDTDGDGVLDRLDLDADNDGIWDLIEANSGPDPDGDGRVSGPVGNNGLVDRLETRLDSGNRATPIPDSDGDRVFDFQDLDADNDGIADVVEAGGTDPDRDGVLGAGAPRVNEDGVAGSPLSPADTDRDGTANYRDGDSDNDGLPDLQEGPALLDRNGDGQVDGADRDGDGILDVVDASSRFGAGTGGFSILRDSNGNGVPDTLEQIVTQNRGRGRNVVTGNDGNDILNGFSDNDTLDGGQGNDIINGGSSVDRLVGGADNDILNGGTNGDRMFGNRGNDLLNGGSGNDRMFGGVGRDRMSGGSGRDQMSGGAGRDRLDGGSDNDRLAGDQGRDQLRGGRGNDWLSGGASRDVLTGGQGRDRFSYRRKQEFGDVITDFEIIKDRIDLRRVKGVRSMDDLSLGQRGDQAVVRVAVGNRFKTLAVLEDVNANTLSDRHFIF